MESTLKLARPKVIAFDCFGTVFDMSPVDRKEIVDYVLHVRQNDFSPYKFPASWHLLDAYSDSALGIATIRSLGIKCVTLSNGSADLIQSISDRARIVWDKIIDLCEHRAYKPHNLDAYRAVEKETGVPPGLSWMVTANVTFGDVESSREIGMVPIVIRRQPPLMTIIDLAKYVSDIPSGDNR